MSVKSDYTAKHIMESMVKYPIYEQILDTTGFAFWFNELCKKALEQDEWYNDKSKEAK